MMQKKIVRKRKWWNKKKRNKKSCWPHLGSFGRKKPLKLCLFRAKKEWTPFEKIGFSDMLVQHSPFPMSLFVLVLRGFTQVARSGNNTLQPPKFEAQNPKSEETWRLKKVPGLQKEERFFYGFFPERQCRDIEWTKPYSIGFDETSQWADGTDRRKNSLHLWIAQRKKEQFHDRTATLDRRHAMRAPQPKNTHFLSSQFGGQILETPQPVQILPAWGFNIYTHPSPLNNAFSPKLGGGGRRIQFLPGILPPSKNALQSAHCENREVHCWLGNWHMKRRHRLYCQHPKKQPRKNHDEGPDKRCGAKMDAAHTWTTYWFMKWQDGAHLLTLQLIYIYTFTNLWQFHSRMYLFGPWW